METNIETYVPQIDRMVFSERSSSFTFHVSSEPDGGVTVTVCREAHGRDYQGEGWRFYNYGWVTFTPNEVAQIEADPGLRGWNAHWWSTNRTSVHILDGCFNAVSPRSGDRLRLKGEHLRPDGRIFRLCNCAEPESHTIAP